MSDFIIEKGVRMPEPDGRHGRSGPRYILPWHRLDVGDSVLVDEGARTSAARYAKQHGLVFITRKTNKGTRLWRAA